MTWRVGRNTQEGGHTDSFRIKEERLLTGRQVGLGSHPTSALICVSCRRNLTSLRFGFLSCKIDIMMHFSLDFKGLMSVYKLLSIIGEVNLLPSVDQKDISSWNGTLSLTLIFVNETDNVIKCYKVHNRDMRHSSGTKKREWLTQVGWTRDVLKGEDPWVEIKRWLGIGNPLQYSCLKNAMDWGAW